MCVGVVQIRDVSVIFHEQGKRQAGLEQNERGGQRHLHCELKRFELAMFLKKLGRVGIFEIGRVLTGRNIL